MYGLRVVWGVIGVRCPLDRFLEVCNVLAERYYQFSLSAFTEVIRFSEGPL